MLIQTPDLPPVATRPPIIAVDDSQRSSALPEIGANSDISGSDADLSVDSGQGGVEACQPASYSVSIGVGWSTELESEFSALVRKDAIGEIGVDDLERLEMLERARQKALDTMTPGALMTHYK